ncbi:MAG: DUF1761 domain-containing protein [Parachlamydiales bacterium]|jgi:hypothetical protein
MAYIDLWLVSVAAIVAAILAFFWFSPYLFGSFFKKELGIKTWKKPVLLVFSLAVFFVLAYFIAFVEAYFNVVNFSDGLVAGGVLFTGLVVPLQLLFFLWRKGRLKLFLAEMGFLALVFLLMGGILAS